MNKSTYHHGDLQNALIDAAAEMLAEEGIQGLSLRKVAKQIGVSHNAPYQHFPDKESLIAAIAEQGFRRLSQAIDQAVANEMDSPARLMAVGRSYVRFMSENPQYLAVMFGPFPHANHPSLSQAALNTLDILVQIVAEGQRDGSIKPGDPREIAGVLWMIVHGLSSVFIAHKLPAQIIGERTSVELSAAFIQLLCEGVQVTLPE